MFESTTVAFGNARPVRKPFTWTYSKLKNFRDCPKRHYHYEIARILGNMDDAIREPESEELKRGNDAHTALAKRVAKGTPLPLDFVAYEEHAKKFVDIANEMNGGIMAEEKWAMTRDYTLTGYFDANVWFRAVVDAVILMPEARTIVVWDWKTGKPKALRGRPDDPVQVLLNAALFMIKYDWIDFALCELVWLDYGMKTTARLKRSDVPTLWASLLPEVQAMEQAYQTINYPPKKNFLCAEWCYVEACPHHGG